MQATDLPALFAQEFHSETEVRVAESGVAVENWRAGGRRSKEYPNKEDASWWLHHGPKMVVAYAEWRERMADFGWQIWHAPGGPAIELELLAMFGDIPVKMFIDRVFVSPQGELAVVDLKAGSREPDNTLQLDIYAGGMEVTLGIRPTYGAYYMARKGEMTELKPLTTSVAQITEELRQFNLAVENEIFLPHRSSHCISCGVRHACAAQNGEQAHLYDPLHPAYGQQNRETT